MLMKFVRSIKLLLIFTTGVFLFGCASTNLKTDVQSQDVSLYEKIYIGEVRVYSNEVAAKSNVALQKKLKSWEEYSRQQLEGYASDSRLALVDTLEGNTGNTLTIDLDVNVQYGNRALRWAVGFGAGKGGVDSSLVVKDPETGAVKYKAQANSELTMGGAGGDIGDVLEKNIKKLIAQYKGS